jgi:hypothetical protein
MMVTCFPALSKMQTSSLTDSMGSFINFHMFKKDIQIMQTPSFRDKYKILDLFNRLCPDFPNPLALLVLEYLSFETSFSFLLHAAFNEKTNQREIQAILTEKEINEFNHGLVDSSCIHTIKIVSDDNHHWPESSIIYWARKKAIEEHLDSGGLQSSVWCEEILVFKHCNRHDHDLEQALKEQSKKTMIHRQKKESRRQKASGKRVLVFKLQSNAHVR